ncbi:MAG: hypothetical protein HKN28_16650 [Alphaproteobacteria bacterium]|nr:hypothetical protein [Alphaproteobacteria bacterium]
MPETKAVSFAADGTSFFENLIDVINPLQHIPGVSTIYRAISGDEIATPAKLIGGALFGGPMGLASAAANLMFEEVSGDDLAGHALALIGDAVDTPELANAVADTAATAPPVPGLAAVASTEAASLTVPNSATPAAATQAATPAVAQMATQIAGPDIIWNGPRVLPSLARATPTLTDAAGPDRSAPDRSVIMSSAQPAPQPMPVSNTPPANIGAAPSTPAAQAARPAWLDAAIADAQAVQGTAQNGKAPQKVEGQPWITDAMLDALGKYREMNLERNR